MFTWVGVTGQRDQDEHGGLGRAGRVSPRGLRRPSPASCFLLSPRPGLLLRKQLPVRPLSRQALRNLPHTAASSSFLNLSSLLPCSHPRPCTLWNPQPAPCCSLKSMVACKAPPRVPPGTPTCVMCVRGAPGGLRWLDAVSLVSPSDFLIRESVQVTLHLKPSGGIPVLGTPTPCSLAFSPLPGCLCPHRGPSLSWDVFPWITNI